MMTMEYKRLVVAGATLPDNVTDRLSAVGIDVETVPGDLTVNAYVERLKGAWGFAYHGFTRLPATMWERLDHLATVCFMGTGYRSFIELPAAPSPIVFTYSPHANASSVAELAVALMLDLSREVTKHAHQVVDGEGWCEEITASMLGARIGIAGMGHVGHEVGRIVSSGFHSRVWYWNRTEHPEFDHLGYSHARSVLDLCERVDVLTLHLDYVRGEDDGIIGAAELAALGPHGILVNTARAELVEPVALREAIENGVIAGAAFDGYYEQPAPPASRDTHGLLRLFPKLIVTPHCGYASEQAQQRTAQMVADNLLAVAQGKKPPHPIPPREASNV